MTSLTLSGVRPPIARSGAVETAKVAMTEVAIEPGEIPEDVPLMDGYFALLGTDSEITYSINTEFQAVVDFYESQMPALVSLVLVKRFGG